MIRYFYIILILVVIAIIAWNIVPIMIGLVKLLIGIGLALSFFAGVFVGASFNKKSE